MEQGVARSKSGSLLRKRVSLLAILVSAGVLVIGGCKDFKGTGFGGGVQLGGLPRTGSGARVSICIGDHSCMSFTRAGESAGTDVYPVFAQQGSGALPHADGTKVVVDVTLANRDGSTVLHGSTTASVELFRPGSCDEYGPVIAVAFDDKGVLRPARVKDFGFDCAPAPTTPATT